MKINKQPPKCPYCVFRNTSYRRNTFGSFICIFNENVSRKLTGIFREVLRCSLRPTPRKHTHTLPVIKQQLTNQALTRRMRCRSLIGPLQGNIDDWIGREPPRPQSQQTCFIHKLTRQCLGQVRQLHNSNPRPILFCWLYSFSKRKILLFIFINKMQNSHTYLQWQKFCKNRTRKDTAPHSGNKDCFNEDVFTEPN